MPATFYLRDLLLFTIDGSKKSAIKKFVVNDASKWPMYELLI